MPIFKDSLYSLSVVVTLLKIFIFIPFMQLNLFQGSPVFSDGCYPYTDKSPVFLDYCYPFIDKSHVFSDFCYPYILKNHLYSLPAVIHILKKIICIP